MDFTPQKTGRRTRHFRRLVVAVINIPGLFPIYLKHTGPFPHISPYISSDGKNPSGCRRVFPIPARVPGLFFYSRPSRILQKPSGYEMQKFKVKYPEVEKFEFTRQMTGKCRQEFIHVRRVFSVVTGSFPITNKYFQKHSG